MIMSMSYKTRATKSEMEAVANLAEDTCSEPSCGMTILVDKEDKAAGRKSRCMACLMRTKMVRGEIK